MQQKQTFNVTVFGLTEHELRILKSVAWLSTTRTRGYLFNAPGASTACDIYLADAESPEAMKEWGTARIKAAAPSIVLSADGQGMFNQRGLKRPIVAAKLLALLDEITIQELRFLPELQIGSEVPADLSDKVLGRPAAGGGFMALVVDDSPTIRKQIELGLQIYGCAVDCVETAEEALDKLAIRGYDIVFLDVVLPGADGYQVCKSIKRDPEKKHIPVVMLTGKSSPFDQIKGSLAGCNSYLTKPVNNALFQDVVKKYLGVASPQRAYENQGSL